MLFKRNVQTAKSDEDCICALCEFSAEIDGKLFCKGKKEVSSTHVCRKYLFDPSKKKFRRQAFQGLNENVEFPPLD